MFLCLLGLFVKLRLILTGYKWGVLLREEDWAEEFIYFACAAGGK
jgi:hypothetical protein